MSEVASNLDGPQNQDAQLAADAIAAGQEKLPNVDVEADYEAAQQFSVSPIDRTGEGAQAAQEATAPQFEVSQPESTTTTAEPTGDPGDYLDMARQVSPAPTGASNVTDDLVNKAIEKGQPGQ
ncbi:hypothetical protein H6F43_06260 [Leptolyngbya sp. FACHB-36]|uniref:hypothetical protein n=1 Tax=Leptolyngbya sp. FACHB-36 TaxID=2692808 RepID=UPI001681927C|nr:hypothetical protein [Leptolyngbya sp. FACHB-36]MBD2019790.1 hypothetical protein [Leptolyngbya sp. FACHB-36]